METTKPQEPQRRDAIIKKYEQGCQRWAELECSEEEDKSSFFPDRLGILQEKMLLQNRTLEAKHRQQELQRTEKWVKMINHWHKFRNSEKVESQVYKGIPLPVRGKVWSLLLEVDKVKAQNRGKYQHLKKQGQLLSEHVHQIDADIRRTFRNHIMFQQRYGVKQQALFHILLAYSIFDREVGYRQGLNWVVAVLLMFLHEEDAFWALTQLMTKPRYAMHGLFKENCAKLERLQKHHDNILKCLVPKIKQHLDEQGVSTASYARKWFQQCFVDGVPFSLMLRFLDIYILEGEPMLTVMSYTALKIHRRHVLKFTGNNLHRFLQDGLRQAWGMHDDVVLKRLQASKAELEKYKCLFPPPGDTRSLTEMIPTMLEALTKQKEMPRKPLGPEPASLLSRPLRSLRRSRIGSQNNRVGMSYPEPAACQDQPSGLAPCTRRTGHPGSYFGISLGTCSKSTGAAGITSIYHGSGDMGCPSLGPLLYTPVFPFNAGVYRGPEGRSLQGLLRHSKAAKPSLRKSSTEAWFQVQDEARCRHKSVPTKLTPLEPTVREEQGRAKEASP